MLKVSDFAELFNISKMTAYRWINLGEVKIVRVGKTIRIEQSEVDRLKEKYNDRRKMD